MGGNIQIAVAIGGTVPDGIGSFKFSGNLAVDAEVLAFIASGDNGDVNIYRYLEGVLDEVISLGDRLDDRLDRNCKET